MRNLTGIIGAVFFLLVGAVCQVYGADPALLKGVPPRSIGPANMSGRITDLAVVESRPSTIYVASASGGLWKTVNNGTTWKPVFEKETTIALGAVAVAAANPDIVWVGTGEANARNSVSWGDGVYKSTDGGQSWTHMGLKDSHHIGRIVIHPTNPDIVYVAALGHLWGPNHQRGLFKTCDGGKTWEPSLFINQDTGFVDVALDPKDPNTLYAAAYQVRRDGFSGGNPVVQYGPGSGLYRTHDGGKNWIKMTDGLPNGPLGRCGFSIYRQDPNIVFAVVQTDKTGSTVQGQAANNKKLGPEAGGIFRSDDRGKTWKYLNSLVPRPFYYGQIRVDPNDLNRLYVLGIALHVSVDGGHKFLEGTAAKGVHVDHHALWIDPRDSSHLVLGNDGGVYFSYDRSATWEHLKNLPLGQFYAIGVDMGKPYRVYGGLQDNGSWGGPSATRDLAGVTIADWLNIFGMDGYYCQIDPHDADTVFCEGQYGILRRINVRTGAIKDIRPRPKAKGSETNIHPPLPPKTPAFRYNWNSPILMSPHNSHTIYYGGNVLFRSRNRGDIWNIISHDLTRGKPGPSEHTGHTITTIAESPRQPGLLYVGSDDGRVHLSPNGGKAWVDLTERLPMPAQRWITRLECSRFDENTVYLSADRHRHDDRAPYLFRSTDRGSTWTSLAANLPDSGPVHVIREDPRQGNLLYVGTEFGLFISSDRGASWHKQTNVLPTVAVHDLVVHPRDRELVIGTHGRAIYVMDVAPLQELASLAAAPNPYLCDIKPATLYRPRLLHNLGIKAFAGQNPPYGAIIYFYLKEKPAEAPVLTIADAKGQKIAELKGAKDAGLQRLVWKLNRLNPKGVPQGPVPAGEYQATLRVGQATSNKKILVEADD